MFQTPIRMINALRTICVTIFIIVLLFQGRCKARNIENNSLQSYTKINRNDYYDDGGSSCNCSDISCECCSKVGPSKMCNMVKLVNVGQELALELSVHIGSSKIFSQNVSLEELEPICYPYGDYNLCVQVDRVKSQLKNDKVCGNFLAKQKGYDEVESVLVKTELFCLPFEAHQLNKHVLQLLRFVSQ